MGSGRSDYDNMRTTYRSYASDSSVKNIKDVFKQNQIHAALNPHGIKFRESCDSVDNPNSRPLIVGVDVTGSMGKYSHEIASGGLTKLIEGIYDNSPIADPHIMFMAIGDVSSDRYPLQVSQFEADTRIIEQLSMIHIEAGGGGNGTESYNLAWYFAANHTKIDSMIKRNQKGYLFTMGDEGWPHTLTRHQVEEVMGISENRDVEIQSWTSSQLLNAAREKYFVFHIIIAQGSHCVYNGGDQIYKEWKSQMDTVLYLTDSTYLSELIITTININEGMDPEQAIGIWEDKTTQAVIQQALQPQF